MLKKSFIHIKGINRDKERAIWESGALDWNDFLKVELNGISSSLRERIIKEIESSSAEFEKGNYLHFADKLPRNEYFRMYNHLKEKCCFLDIETTGLSKERDIITVIGVYNGKENKIFIDGKNMGEFAKEIAKYDMIVTFNGACFDLPFIRAKNPNLKMPAYHIDLRYALKKLGYSGGLKLIEKSLGIERDEKIAEVDGYEAVRLWKAYKKGDGNALKKLIDYNIADVENLKSLMDFAFEKLCESTFVYHNEI